MYKEKLQKLEIVILATEDEKKTSHLNYLTSVIDKTITLVENTVRLNTRIEHAKSYCNKDIDLAIRELNQSQRITLDALEAVLSIVNRIFKYYSLEPYYEGSFREESIMEYALSFVEEYAEEP